MARNGYEWHEYGCGKSLFSDLECGCANVVMIPPVQSVPCMHPAVEVVALKGGGFRCDECGASVTFRAE